MITDERITTDIRFYSNSKQECEVTEMQQCLPAKKSAMYRCTFSQEMTEIAATHHGKNFKKEFYP
jgi:hypothetical protein